MIPLNIILDHNKGNMPCLHRDNVAPNREDVPHVVSHKDIKACNFAGIKP